MEEKNKRNEKERDRNETSRTKHYLVENKWVERKIILSTINFMDYLLCITYTIIFNYFFFLLFL